MLIGQHDSLQWLRVWLRGPGMKGIRRQGRADMVHGPVTRHIRIRGCIHIAGAGRRSEQRYGNGTAQRRTAHTPTGLRQELAALHIGAVFHAPLLQALNGGRSPAGYQFVWVPPRSRNGSFTVATAPSSMRCASTMTRSLDIVS